MYICFATMWQAKNEWRRKWQAKNDKPKWVPKNDLKNDQKNLIILLHRELCLSPIISEVYSWFQLCPILRKIFEVNSGQFTYYSECNTARKKVNLETPAHVNDQKTQQNFQVFFTVFWDKNKRNRANHRQILREPDLVCFLTDTGRQIHLSAGQ